MEKRDIHEELVLWVLNKPKMTRKPPVDAWDTEKTRDSYERTMKPLHYLMTIIGAMPVTPDQNGVLSVKIFSPIMYYSIIVYIVQSVSSIAAIYTRFTNNINDPWILQFGLVVHCLQYIASPITLWRAMPGICRHLERVHRLHIKFRRITGCDVEYGLERVVLFLAVFIVVIGSTFCLSWGFSESPDKIWRVIPFILPLILNMGYDATFCMACIMIGITATTIIDSLKEKMKRFGNSDRASKIIEEYRGLWLELSHVLQSHNEASTVTFSYHVTHLFLLLTVELYSVLSSLTHRWIFGNIVLLSGVILFLFELGIIANAAQYATNKFESAMFDHAVLIPDTELSPSAKIELHILTNTISTCPRSVDIGGYLVINRRWLIDMLGSLMGSLIILVQFQTAGQYGGGGDESESNINKTSNYTSL